MARSGNGKGRRRGGKRKVTDKDDVTETRKAQTNRLPIDGNRLLHHMNTLKGINQERETIRSMTKKAKESAKLDRISWDVVEDMVKLEKADPLEFREYLEQLGVGLKHTGQPFQINVFDTAYGDPVAQAKAEGRADGKAGRTPNNRYQEGTAESEGYQEAYMAEQATLVPGADKLTAAEKQAALAGG